MVRFFNRRDVNIAGTDAALHTDHAYPIRLVPESGHGRGIAKAILAMAHTLDLKVLAEGVETAPQRAFLSANGCDSVARLPV